MSKDVTRRTGREAARSNSGDVASFLDRLAQTPNLKAAGGRGRLVFAMDATASREPTWDRACHIQAEMFRETEVLGGLEVQLVFYRGFGECKASPWVDSSGDLVRRMTAVRCLGGQTQIGKVLRHTLKETERKKVNALVFVGDCMEEDVDRLCHHAGRLGVLGTPAFMFQEGGRADRDARLPADRQAHRRRLLQLRLFLRPAIAGAARRGRGLRRRRQACAQRLRQAHRRGGVADHQADRLNAFDARPCPT